MARPTAKLDESTVLARLKFRPAPGFLRRVFAAYQRRPPPYAARELLKLVDRYYINVQLEQAAPPLSGALDRLSQMREAAVAFTTALAQRGKRPAAEEPELAQAIAAARYIDDFREEKAEAAGVMEGFPVKLDSVWDVVSELAWDLQRCEQAIRASAGRCSSFQDGEAWKEFVRGVRSWARRFDMPAGARKDDGTSPFVLMFYAMQQEFPQKFRRHHQSEGALATAISSALKKHREK